MTRIFLILAGIDTVALAASAGVGAASKFGDHALFLDHFILGLFTAILTLLVHCLIFIYFLGTGRWVKEVGLAYALPDAGLPRLTRDLKRTTFPPALGSMLLVIATVAAGAGADPDVGAGWPWPIHFTLALVTQAVNLWAFWIEYRNVRANGRILDEVMREVDRIRAERGLPSNAEALQQDGV
jgi:hypothetical protein